MYKKIRKDLINLQDEKFRQFNSVICPGAYDMLGIKVPVLRNYAQKLVKQGENFKDYIYFTETKYFEEVMLQGMLIGFIRNIDTKELLKIIENFVTKIDNWCICDIFCAGLKVVNKNKEIFWNFIQKYLKSDKEFELRFAVVMILSYFVQEEYLNKIFKIFNRINHNGYYVKMAVAWAVSVAFVKYQDKTFEFLKQNNLDDWTYNKSLQKIRESLRVAPETKEIIKNMKR